MANYIMTFLYIVSIIFIAYYGITFINYKYIKKDIRFFGVGILEYILNTEKVLKGSGK